MDDIRDEFKNKTDDMDDKFHETKGEAKQKIDDMKDDDSED